MDFQLWVSDEEARVAWEQFVKAHIRPGRLLAVAQKLEEITESEKEHLERCESCRRTFEVFQKDPGT